VAARVAGLPPSPTVAIAERARTLRAQGASVLDLAGGDPDFPTPAHVVEAAVEALRHGETHYGPSRGLLALREAIAERLELDHRVRVDPSREIIVTPGGKQALLYAVHSLVEPRDEVLIPEPSWPSYSAIVGLAGGIPVPVPLDATAGFRLTPDALAPYATRRTRMVILANPNNPTGTVLSAAELQALAAWALARDLWVLGDEIYEKITFDDRRCPSLVALSDLRSRVLLVNGFSKAYAMTGWRLGYLVGPPDIIDCAQKLQEQSVTCPSPFLQRGAIAAARGPQTAVREMVAEYQRRRAYLIDAARHLRWRVRAPEGAFYLFPDIADGGRPSAEVAEALLTQAHVATTPGVAFGRAGEGHLRLSFAVPPVVLEQAVARLATFQDG
jgi:aspartate aminotransferase